MNKPDATLYTYRVIWSPEDKEFVGLCSEFPSMSWLEPEQEAAFKGIVKAVAEVLADMQQNGETVPEPLSSRTYSGKFVVRVGKELHRQLAMQAAEAQVSLNQFVVSKVSR